MNRNALLATLVPGPARPDATPLALSNLGSLLEALCKAQPGTTLETQSDLSGTLDFSSSPLILSKNITLEGPRSVVLSSSGKGRLLEVKAGADAA